MDAAKDDVIGFRTTRGVAGQLERVAGDISELDDLIALVMVPKDENPCSEGGLRGSGAFDPNDPINIATKKLYDRNIVVVFSAGNSGPGPDTHNPSSKAPWVISVAAGTKEGGLASFSSRGIPAADRPWPTGDKTAAVEAALDWGMAQTQHNTRAIVVVRGDTIVGERYAPGWTGDTPQISWSAGKSITAALVGILVRRGELNVDDVAPVKAWRADGDPRGQIRIRDLLHMSSGLNFANLGLTGPESYVRTNKHMRIYFDGLNVFEHAVNQPLEIPPNTQWRYRNSDPLTLGRIVREKVEARGEDYLTFPQRELFDKIGAKNFVLETDAWGNFIMTGFDYGSARDWARFGLLHLRDGVFQGTRILPEGWVKFISTPAPADKSLGYGGLFWLNRGGAWKGVPKDAFMASGHMGQYTMVIPSRDMVVVRLGPSPAGEQEYFSELVSRILKGVPEKSVAHGFGPAEPRP